MSSAGFRRPKSMRSKEKPQQRKKTNYTTRVFSMKYPVPGRLLVCYIQIEKTDSECADLSCPFPWSEKAPSSGGASKQRFVAVRSLHVISEYQVSLDVTRAQRLSQRGKLSTVGLDKLSGPYLPLHAELCRGPPIQARHFEAQYFFFDG